MTEACNIPRGLFGSIIDQIKNSITYNGSNQHKNRKLWIRKKREDGVYSD